MIDVNSEKRLCDLLESYGNNSHTHLYHLGDKEWFWDSDYEALIVYRTALNRRIVLGDLGVPVLSSRYYILLIAIHSSTVLRRFRMSGSVAGKKKAFP